MIVLENIYKRYKYEGGFIAAANGISMSIKKGEFVSIIGHSGSGKSTMLHMLGMLDKPDSGNYILDGKSIIDLGDRELAKLRNKFFGFVFQSFFLLPRETILSNVLMPMYYAPGQKIDKERAIELLRRVGLEKRLHSRPTQLSGGQQQRVAIARALIMNPQVILADEPTGNLDTATGADVLRLLQELNDEGKTLIIVTHDEEIARRTKHVFKLKDGKIEDEVFL